jgi:hypothetical protein
MSILLYIWAWLIDSMVLSSSTPSDKLWRLSWISGRERMALRML